MTYPKFADRVASLYVGFALIAAACGDSGGNQGQQPTAGTAGDSGQATLGTAGDGGIVMAGTGGDGRFATAGTAGDSGQTPYTSTPQAPPSSTWCEVQQTLQDRCAACHDGNQTAGAPMPLLSYADLQAPAASDPSRKVYELVAARIHDPARPMPPQQPLTEAELASVDAWIAAGAEGDGADSCVSMVGMGGQGSASQTAWPEHCDAVYKLLAHGPGADDEPFMVPAGEEIHPKISVPAPWGDQPLQAIAFRSITDNPKVLHHWIVYGPNREFLVGWAPGKTDAPLPPDVGMHLAGGTLTLDMHYNNLLGEQAEPDRSGVEVCALTPEHFREYTGAVHMGFTRLLFSIPAKTTGYAVTGECTVTSNGPVTLLSASPHAHRFGRHMKFAVHKASGETIVMHDAAFDFNEQQSYKLAPLVQIETGDKVITTCIYDNTTDHVVRFGENTDDEMCFNFAAYYPMGALQCSPF